MSEWVTVHLGGSQQGKVSEAGELLWVNTVAGVPWGTASGELC